MTDLATIAQQTVDELRARPRGDWVHLIVRDRIIADRLESAIQAHAEPRPAPAAAAREKPSACPAASPRAQRRTTISRKGRRIIVETRPAGMGL